MLIIFQLFSNFFFFFAMLRKQTHDAALVDMIAIDVQPFSIVEDKDLKAMG